MDMGGVRQKVIRWKEFFRRVRSKVMELVMS